MYNRKVIDRYVNSIFELAKSSKNLPEIEKNMGEINAICQSNRDFVLLVQSPIIPNHRKNEVLKKIFGKKLHKATSAFLELLAKKGRVNDLSEISDAFLKRCIKEKNIKIVTVHVATPLSKKSEKRLIEYLKKNTNMDIDLKVKIDKSLIGGLVIYYDDVMLELSILGQMKKLKQEFIFK